MSESELKSDVGQTDGSRSADGTRQDFCRIVDGVPGCILVANAQGQIVYANKVALACFGRPMEDIKGSGWLRYLDPHLVDEAKSTWQQCVQRRSPLNVTWRFRQQNDTYRWKHLKAEPAFDKDSTEIAWYILGVDVDEQFKAQEALRTGEQEAREILDRVPAMISSWIDEGMTYANRRLSEYVGARIAGLSEGSLLDYSHPDDRAAVANHFIHSSGKDPKEIEYRLRDKNRANEPIVPAWQEVLAQDGGYEAEHRIRRADGTYRWHLRRAAPMTNDEGQIIQWFAVDIDIDDQKRTEERIRQLRTSVSDNSRTSMGAEICASIAHEINQPLSSVLVNAQACARWLSIDPPRVAEAVASVERIVRDARAVDAAMRNVRLLFKRQPPVKYSCNMTQLIRDAVSLIEGTNGRLAQVQFEFEEPRLMVLVDRHQIQQVIVNLVVNAMEALQGIARPPCLRIRALRIADRQILTEFIDNGCGLPAQRPEGVFDAFFTTKEGGMGIGLSLSRSIVESHRGRLWGENNPDHGATFSLLLEASEPRISGG